MSVVIDTHKLNEIRVYLLENSKKIRVRNCVEGTNDDYDLLNTEVGLKVDNGELTIGKDVSIANPTSLSCTIDLSPADTQAYFIHVIDPSANATSMTDEAIDLEFYGTVDERDECELLGIGKPRNVQRIVISDTSITLEINSSNELTVKYDGNSPSGLQPLVATNVSPII